MFSDVWNKIKELAKKMLPKKSIENVFHVTPAMSDRMADAIQLWSDMYEGNSPWLKNGTREDPEVVVSLGLPAFIASEKARMVTLEMKSEINAPTKEVESPNPDYVPPKEGNLGELTMGEGSPTIKEDVADGPTERAEYLESQYKKLKRQIRRQLEYGIAKGGLVIKPYVVKFDEKESASEDVLYYDKNLYKAEIEFDYVQADRFFPLSFDANNKVIEAAFIQTKVDKAKERVYIRLEHHKLEGRRVTVQNLAFESTDMSLANSNNIKSASNLGNPIPLTDVAEWSNFSPKTVIDGVDRLLFSYFRMPEANTVDPYSPLGVSGYSRVVNLIKDADEQYSRFLWEFEGGELAVDVDRDAMKFITQTEAEGGLGYTVLPKKQQRLFRKIDLNAEDTYNVFAPALRDASLISGLNVIFMRIEDACGLSRGTISDVTTQEAKTATELKIQKQRSYATNADIQVALQDALEDAIYVMDVYCTLYDITPDGKYEVSYEWDDSIIMDTESELAKRMTLMQNGLASKLETRMWYFGETENQARAALQQVDDEARKALEQNLQAEQQMSAMKSPADTTSAKVSTGKQADSLDNPDKSEVVDEIKVE